MTEELRSRQSAPIRFLRELARDAEARRENGLYLCDGEKLLQEALHVVHVVGDELHLGLGVGRIVRIVPVSEFGILELDLLLEGFRPEVPIVVALVVDFQEIAAVGLAGLHHGDGDLVLPVHLLGFHQQVAATVLAVEIDLRGAVLGRPGHRHHPGDAQGDRVPQERRVLDVGQQHPVLVALHPEHLPVVGELDLVGVLDASLGVVGRVATAADAHLEHLGVGFIVLFLGGLVHPLGVAETDGAVHPRVLAFRQLLGFLFPGNVDPREVGEGTDGVVGGVVRQIGARVVPRAIGGGIRAGVRTRIGAGIRPGIGPRIRARIFRALHRDAAAGGMPAVPGLDGDARGAGSQRRDEALRIHDGGLVVVRAPLHALLRGVRRRNHHFELQSLAFLQGGGSRLDGNTLHRDRCDLYLVRFTGHARKSERVKCQLADIPDFHCLTGFV